VTVDRIAVVRALPGIGDMLCAVPALRAVRAAHPRARITLVGLPSAAWFVDRYPDLVGDLLVVEGVPGLPEVEPDPTVAARFDAAARERRFDLALQLHGNGVVTNPLTALLSPRMHVGAYLPGHWRPSGASIPYPGGHEIHRLLAVAEAAGCPGQGDAIELPIRDHEWTAAAALVADGDGRPPYVCLHPGASRPDNRWPTDRYAAIGDRLADDGRRVVLTGTPGERSLVDAVARAMRAPVTDACGRTDVGTLAALFTSADVVLSNDTGAAHVAAAVATPSVIVYPAGADRARWAPLAADRHIGVGPVPDRSGEERWPTVEAVLRAVGSHLATTPTRRSLEDAP